MVLATKSMGLNPEVLSFAYADMSSVSSPRPLRKNISLGTERLVQFYSSDPEDLGIEIEHSDDGYVRVASNSGNGMYGGTVHVGDIVCEIAGVNMRRPITEHMWKLTTGLMKVAPRPIEVIVAEECTAQEDNEETPVALGNELEKKTDNINSENTQPSFVKQAMSMWQNLNLNGVSKEEFNESPGNGTSDTASMSDGHEGSTIQLPDPYNDPERFGVERRVIFHTESLGIKLHRCPNEGIVQILHVDHSVAADVREGDDDGRLEVGDVIVEVGGVDLRHKFIGQLEWADMVYFVQNVGRPLDIVVVEDNHCMKERDVDSGAMDEIENVEKAGDDDVKVESEVDDDTEETEVTDHDENVSIEDEEHLDVDGEPNEEVEQEGLNGAVADEDAVQEPNEALEEKEEDNEEEEDEEEAVEELQLPIDNECESDNEKESKQQEEVSIDIESYEQDKDNEHQLGDTDEVEKSGDEPVDVMTALVEQFVATKEKVVAALLPEDNEPVQEEQEDKAERTRQHIEDELSQLPKFSPEWFSLKSELLELCAVENVLDENKEASKAVAQKSVANIPGVKAEQSRSTNSFYFRTHPKNKPSHVTVSSFSEVQSQKKKDAESNIVSRDSMTATDSLEEPPLTPTSIIEEDDAFEVTMWAGPGITTPQEVKETAFPSTFGQSLFNLDDDDAEAPFTGGINFDTPPRVPVSALFSHAFIVNRGGDVGSPLFVVKKTLPDQNKTNDSSEYLQMTSKQPQHLKTSNPKPALDMSDVALHQDMPLESAVSTESAWDQLADNYLFDTFCGDSLCQGLISDTSDIHQMKEKEDKPKKKRGLFRKLRKRKKKDEMLGYGTLEDEDDDYRSAAHSFAPVKGKKMTNVSGFHPIDDEVDL